MKFATSQIILATLADARCSICKAHPGDASWPSLQTWAKLNETLSGKLLLPTPPAAVCHREQPVYNVTRCAEVQQMWSTYEFHVQDPISVMWDQYSDWSCLPNNNSNCSAAGYPAVIVNATSAADVKVAIRFAKQHRIRLNLKSTGHDYLGRSNAPGTLSIWLHHLNSIQYHDTFESTAGKTKAVTVGGGTQMWDIYKATDLHNQTIVGGGGKTVGIGGYITGGGHSILSPKYGLAADNVLEMEIVTPAGDIVVANENKNADLFWAIRGGGGSTFGVITKITLKTHPSPKVTWASWLAIAEPKASFLQDLVGYVASQTKYLMDSGLSGYNYITQALPNPIPGPGLPDILAGVMGGLMLQDSTSSEAYEIFRPLNETLQKRWKGKASLHVMTEDFPTFLAWYSKNYDMNKAGGSSWLASRLLDEAALNHSDIGEALWEASKPGGGMSFFFVAGQGVQGHRENAVNTAWRRAYVHALTSIQFNNTASGEKAAETVKRALQPLRELTPRSGAYINEALPFENNWQTTFWGQNYQKLLRIKRSIDPEDVFWCFPCVGSERWEQHNGRLCKINR